MSDFTAIIDTLIATRDGYDLESKPVPPLSDIEIMEGKLRTYFTYVEYKKEYDLSISGFVICGKAFSIDDCLAIIAELEG